MGARLVFVLRHWTAFRANLLGIVWPLNSGYDLWGGLLVGALVGALLVRRHRLGPAAVLDALAPGVVILLMAVSLADFFGGGGYGTVTNLPWGLRLFDLPVRRHPVQLYEAAVGLLALGAWLRAERWVGGPAARALLTVAVYAAGRLFTEAFRAGGAVTPDGYRLLQLGLSAADGRRSFPPGPSPAGKRRLGGRPSRALTAKNVAQLKAPRPRYCIPP